MRKAIATVSVAGTLPHKLEAIAAARFDGIELFDADLVSCPLSPAEVRRRCADLGLSIDLYQPIRDIDGVPPDQFAQTLRRVRGKFAVMAELGVDRALACSNCQPDAVTGDLDLLAEQLSAAGDVAAEFGIEVGYEALAWGRTTNRFHQAWDVVTRAAHPNIGVVVDTFHMLSRGDDAEALGDLTADKLSFLQIADAPRLGMEVLEWSRHHRCFPGQGNLDVAPLVAAVYERGYRGPLSLEIFSDVVREADPRLTALDAMRSLRHLEEELRARWARPEAAPTRPRVDLFDPPPAPDRVDPGFVEICAADPADRKGLEQTLTGLGFHRAGTHRHLPVHWWRNGAAHLVLDTGHPELPLCVTAVGVTVPAPADTAIRAGALLWPKATTRRRPGDVPLPGLATPGDVAVILTGPQGSAADWQRDFDPVPGAGTGDAHGIDHVGITVDRAGLPAEQSFFRTVLGMSAGPVSEFIQPSGRMWSRPLHPGRGDLRVVLGVDDRAGAHEGDRGLNQVAVAVPDVFAAAERARAAGIELMPVPDNYYVDLAGRFDLDPAEVERMRRLAILYDATPQGRLWHFFTPLLGDGFYLEVLQRGAAYSGYGAPNTTVRLAMHSRS